MKRVKGSKTLINIEDQISTPTLKRRNRNLQKTPERGQLNEPNQIYNPIIRKFDTAETSRLIGYTMASSPIRIRATQRDKSPSFNTSPMRAQPPESLGVRYRAPKLESSTSETPSLSSNRQTKPTIKRISTNVTTTTPTNINETSRSNMRFGENNPPRDYRSKVYGNESFGVQKKPVVTQISNGRTYSTPLKPLEVSNVISVKKGHDTGNTVSTPVLNYEAARKLPLNVSPLKYADGTIGNPIRMVSQPTISTPRAYTPGVSPARIYNNFGTYQPVSPYRGLSTSMPQISTNINIGKPIYGTTSNIMNNYSTPVYRERTPVTYGNVMAPIISPRRLNSPMRSTRVYSPLRSTRVYSSPVRTIISPARRIYSPFRVAVPVVPVPVQRTPIRANKYVMESRRPIPAPKYLAMVEKSPDMQRSVVIGGGPIPPHEPEPYYAPKSYKTPEIVNVLQPEKTARREVTKITEVLDTDVSDRAGFFNNNQTVGTGLDINDTMANKLSMNDEGTTIYASGLNGTSVVGVNGPNLTKLGPTDTDRPSTTVECVRDGHVVLQEPNSNDLFLVDRDLNTVKAIDGLTESGAVAEDLHHYRHSLDYAYFLWRSGQDNLSIIDTETFECVEVIQQFWTFDNASSMPVAACANVNADKIVATSQAGPENYIIHYYEDSIDKSVAYARPVGEVIPSMYKLTALEVSADERRVYIGGLAIVDGRAGSPVVITCLLDETLREVAANLLDDLDYGTPRRIVRKEGTEILIIGCDRHFAILEYVGDKLIQIASLPNVHDNEICDFVIRGRFMYSTAFNEPLIKATEFNVGGGARTTTSVINPGGGPLDNPNSRYGAFQTDKFSYAGLDDLQKVTTSVDGARVFAGGRGLHRFETAGGKLNPIEIDVNKGKTIIKFIFLDINYFGLKATPNSMLLIQEPSTNNLVVLTEELDFERNVDGREKCIFRKKLEN